MTLALYGKSRSRQVLLVVAAFLSVALATVAAIGLARVAFAHHINTVWVPGTCDDLDWSLQLKTGEWGGYREAVFEGVTISEDGGAPTAVTLAHRFVYKGADAIFYQDNGAGSVAYSGFVRQYSGSFAPTPSSNTALAENIDGAVTSFDIKRSNGAIPFAVGDIFKVGNEVMQVKTITVVNSTQWTVEVEQRGGAQSTPAAHDVDDAVEKWTRNANPEGAANQNINMSSFRSPAGAGVNCNCQDLGLDSLGKYNWNGSSFVYDDFSDFGGIGQVNISGVTGAPSFGNFATNTGYFVTMVITKGSTINSFTPYNPSVTSGSFTNNGFLPHGISHVEFCGGFTEPQDRQVRIIKDRFSPGNTDSKTFEGDIDGTTVDLPWSVVTNADGQFIVGTFDVPIDEAVTVTEDDPTALGYSLDGYRVYQGLLVSCEVNGQAISLTQASIPADENDYTVCIDNSRDPEVGTVIVRKVIPNDPTNTTDFSGSAYIGGNPHSTVSDLATDDDYVILNAAFGTYSFVEDDPAPGFILLGTNAGSFDGGQVVCDERPEKYVDGVNETATLSEGGQTVVLCVMNLKMEAKTICKVIEDNLDGVDNDGTTWDFDVTYTRFNDDAVQHVPVVIGPLAEGAFACETVGVPTGRPWTVVEDLTPTGGTWNGNATGYPRFHLLPRQACGGSTVADGWVGLGGSGMSLAYCNKSAGATGEIRGHKWHDLNGSQQQDLGEPFLAGWTMQLKDAQGNVLASTVTDIDGYYEFLNVPVGTGYQVCEVGQPGWTATFPTAGTLGQDLCQPGVGVTAGEPNTLDYGNQRTLSVTFIKVICPRYSDVPSNQTGAPDHVGQPAADGYHSAAELGAVHPVGANDVVDPANLLHLPQPCRREPASPDWTFNLFADVNAGPLPLNPTVTTTGIGVANGVTVPLTGVLLSQATGGDGLWVREAYQGSAYGFGEIKCYNDHLNWDNNEFILVTDTSVTQVTCIAYNVAHREITVKKVVVGEENDTEFEYIIRNQGGIALGDAAPPTGSVAEDDLDGDSYFVDTGTHTVTETLPAGGWQTPTWVVFHGSETGCDVRPQVAAQGTGLVASIPDGIGDYTVCFFNIRQGDLVFEKVNIGGAPTDDFTGTYTGGLSPSGTVVVDHAGGPQSVTLIAGNYSVGEDTTGLLAAGYIYLGLKIVAEEEACGEGGAALPDSGIASVPPGGSIKVCLFNEKLATLRIHKDEIGTITGKPATWDFQTGGEAVLNDSLPGEGIVTFENLVPGGYTATELNGDADACVDGGSETGDWETRWSETSDVTNSTPGLTTDTLTLAAGEVKDVWFFNRDCGEILASPNLVIEKLLDVEGDMTGTTGLAGFQFRVFHNDVEVDSDLGTVAIDPFETDAFGTIFLGDLATGEWRVEEVLQADYRFVGSRRNVPVGAAACLDAEDTYPGENPEPVTLNLGDTQTAAFCFYNQPDGTIIVHKLVDEGNGVFNGAGWDFTIGTSTDGCSLDPGYEVTRTTGGDGRVTFDGLQVENSDGEACVYDVEETLLPGYTPLGGVSILGIQVTSGQTVEVSKTNVLDTTPTPTPETPTETPPTETETPPTETEVPPTETEVPPTETEDPPSETPVTPTEDTAGEITPGTTNTPGAPGAGQGLFTDSQGAAAQLMLALLGLAAVSGGLVLLAVGRKR